MAPTVYWLLLDTLPCRRLNHMGNMACSAIQSSVRSAYTFGSLLSSSLGGFLQGSFSLRTRILMETDPLGCLTDPSLGGLNLSKTIFLLD